ncbi:MAG: hypothetical protein LBK56_03140 [Gracilibacteraceae bacterium]|jgi:hypothetical protein|nr:hypothetical protein [Gracilibacteraceae bacterium]
MSEKQQTGGLSVGGSSILVIFVVLSLTIFAALSFMSARADLRLAEKQAQSALEYYAADSAATRTLAAVDARLRALSLSPAPAENADAPSYAEAAAGALSALAGLELELTAPGALSVAFEEAVNERQVLRVVLRVPGAEIPGAGWERYRIVSWRIVNVKEWEGGNNTIEVWQGE